MLSSFIELVIFQHNLINNLANTKLLFKYSYFFLDFFISIYCFKPSEFSFSPVSQRELFFWC